MRTTIFICPEIKKLAKTHFFKNIDLSSPSMIVIKDGGLVINQYHGNIETRPLLDKWILDNKKPFVEKLDDGNSMVLQGKDIIVLAVFNTDEMTLLTDLRKIAQNYESSFNDKLNNQKVKFLWIDAFKVIFIS